jgi:hypothetical protein
MSFIHGYSAYRHGRCRCPVCTETQRMRMAAFRARAFAQGLPPGDPRHGTDSAYSNYGCRCPACVRTHSQRMREYKARKRREATT